MEKLLTRGLSVRETENWRLAREFKRQTTRAKINVAVLDNWGDFWVSMRDLTPDGNCVWENVAFSPYGSVLNPDFVLVLNSIRPRWKVIRIAPERLWFASAEAPNAVHANWNRGQGSRSTVISCAAIKKHDQGGRKYIHAPGIMPTWHVHKTYQELSAMKDVPKTRSLSWITSNFRNLAGHRARMAFLDKLRQEVDFDLFGRGFAPIADKWDGLAPYRYSIVFENTIAPMYFTEKLMDCFVSHTLPLYYGAPDIAKYFPEKAMVKIDPNDPKVFDRVREIVSSDLWTERLPYILEAKELVLKKHNMYARLATYFKTASENAASPKKFIMLRSHKLNYKI